jgi:16S rRNA (adenine1518-N6/adenine1519-N6)-dimethyltransferase
MYKAKKSFGQNFLINKHILNSITIFIDLKEKNILEIGPGTGNLTEFILKQKPKNLFCIEKDKDLIPILKERFSDQSVNFLNQDAENIDLKSIIDNKIIIISNLPYNVGTRILLNLNLQINQIEGIVVMLQKEVIERIMAKKNTEAYGKISFLFQYLYKLEFMMEVSRNNFSPPPNVQSAIIKMIPKKDIDLNFYLKMNEFLTLCFQFRRKKLSTILKKTKFEYILPNINGNKRIEEFDFNDIQMFLDTKH